MAPKQKGDDQQFNPQLMLLGRQKHDLSMGLVGLPNIGKSLTFTCLTKCQAPSENYPFCTIQPQQARVAIPDKRFDHMCKIFKPKSKVPAYMDCWDIAGLIKGASKGEGLGNEFLSNIASCDGIYHLIRVFEDQDVVSVEDGIDPIRDLETIEDELRLKDIQKVNLMRDDLIKKCKVVRDKISDAQNKEKLAIAERILGLLEEKKYLYTQTYNEKEVKVLNELLLLTAKPVVFLINMSEKDYVRQKNKYMLQIKKYLEEHHPEAPVIPYCAQLEARLLELEEDQRKAELQKLGDGVKSQINKIIQSGYKALNLVHFLTAGPDEVRCWTIRKFTKAPQAAGTIHTDFENFFICAEVYKYEDLKKLGTEGEVRKQGLIKTVGKEYIVEDGDICFFKHNAKKGK